MGRGHSGAVPVKCLSLGVVVTLSEKTGVISNHGVQGGKSKPTCSLEGGSAETHWFPGQSVRNNLIKQAT